MLYNYKEYNNIFDTPAKMQQERVVVSKIMDLLNKNKYDNLDEFISKNQSYQNFLKNNQMDVVVKHFGNTLKEEDFTRILENLKELTKTKQQFESENIKTTSIEDKEYVSFEGNDKTYFLDNSNSSKSIEEQMKDMQPTEHNFQTSDIKQNTENMFKELEENKKESLNLSYLHEINFDLLSNEEKELYIAANEYQQNITGVIRVDLKRAVIVDENDNIMRIEKENGEIVIKGDDELEANTKEGNEKQMSKGRQLTLRPNPNTIYSA